MSNEDDALAELWKQVLAVLASDERITPQLEGFLALAVPQGVVMGGTLLLQVRDDFTRSMIDSRARVPLQNTLTSLPEIDEIGPLTGFAIVVNPELDEPQLFSPSLIQSPPPTTLPEGVIALPTIKADTAPSLNPSPIRSNVSGETRLNPKYSFENFVVGQSNRFAHAAAFAVAEAPASAYNPLFIYGDSGLGKTHLIHAIGNYAREMEPETQILYVSSEEFTNDFINSIANNQGASFQTRYRNVDILLIDDIQFLQRAPETQEAFFHTFNTLHDHNKQVVITSDLPPKSLTGFEDRMRSRFEWGLITDVQVPDLETRLAILRKKARNEQIYLPDDVLEFMAIKVSRNIRELEGALIRVTAFASLQRSVVDMNLVQTVLKELITVDDADSVIDPGDIVACTADYFRLTIDDLYGSSRSQTIATARQIAMYLCRELTTLSLPKIGQIFGGRDHTTVIYANKKIGELMKERRSIYNQVTELTTRIKQR